MKTVKVKPNQCLEDIALEHYGAIEGVEHLLNDNRAILTSGFMTPLAIGMELQVREQPINQQVYQQMQRKGIIPASIFGPMPEAIGIGADFYDDFNPDFNSTYENE